MEGFCRKEVGARKLLAKKARSPSLRGKNKGSYWVDYLIFLWGIERAPMTDYFTGADQKLPDCLVKSYLWGSLEGN